MDSEHTLSVLTFNIAHGRGLSPYQGLHSKKRIEHTLDKISSLIRFHSPDIAALQEADVGSHWNHSINTVEHIRECARYPHSEAGVHNIRHGKKPLAYGNAVISKGEIYRTETVPFGTGELGEKGFMITGITLGGTRHVLINLHLDYRSQAERVGQIEIILARIESAGLSCHPIICGDFNSSAKGKHDAVSHLFSFMQRYDTYTLSPSGGSTFPSPFPVTGLDFILTPSRYRIVDCTIIRSLLSDHRPVLARYAFTS